MPPKKWHYFTKMEQIHHTKTSCCCQAIQDDFSLLYIWSIVVGAAYAASDEWHQTMVPSRSGSVEDVLIDAAGIVVGVLVAMGDCVVG